MLTVVYRSHSPAKVPFMRLLKNFADEFANRLRRRSDQSKLAKAMFCRL